jgi:hypothetical protein
MSETTSCCRNLSCRKELVRKRYPNGRIERTKHFLERKYCNRRCAFDDPTRRENMASNMALRHTRNRTEIISRLDGTDHPNRIAALQTDDYKELKRQQTQSQWDRGERVAGVHIAKGRREGRPYTGLTDEQVRSIMADRRPQPEIAKAFGVGVGTVSRIKHRQIKQYAHVDGEIFIGQEGGSGHR